MPSRPAHSRPKPQFTASDLGLGWHVVRTPGPACRAGEAPAGVTVTAPARELLLILNRRLPATAVTGDAAVLDRWRQDARF